MLFDPRQALESPLLIAVTLAIVMIGKPLAAIVIVAVLGYSSRIGLGVALALAQIGEFSFLLATLGRQVGALPDGRDESGCGGRNRVHHVESLALSVGGPLERFIERHPWLWRALNRKAAAERDSPRSTGTRTILRPSRCDCGIWTDRTNGVPDPAATRN